MSPVTATYTDDPTILNSDKLWRRLRPDNFGFIYDSNIGRYRPSSAAFKDPSDRLSVNLQRLTTVEATLLGLPGFGIAEFTAGLPRRQKHIVVRDPEPDNEAHTLVCGRITQGQRNELAHASAIIVLPEPEHGNSD